MAHTAYNHGMASIGFHCSADLLSYEMNEWMNDSQQQQNYDQDGHCHKELTDKATAKGQHSTSTRACEQKNMDRFTEHELNMIEHW